MVMLKFCIITIRKRSLGQGNIFTGVCQSFCPGGLPLHDVTSCLAAWSHFPSGKGVSVLGLIFLPWGSLSWGVSVQEGLLPGGLCPGGLCPGVSVRDTSRTVCILLECILV